MKYVIFYSRYHSYLSNKKWINVEGKETEYRRWTQNLEEAAQFNSIPELLVWWYSLGHAVGLLKDPNLVPDQGGYEIHRIELTDFGKIQ